MREIHTQFDLSSSPWSKKVEAAYIPMDALNHGAPSSTTYPRVEKGTTLFRAPLETGWAFQRHTLREYGVVVAGPELRSLINPVRLADMQQAAAVILRGWLEQSRRDASWVAWARVRRSQAFVVLTLCRLFYSLETGGVVSKPTAARWAQKKFKEPWNILIEQSIANQHSDQEASEEDYRVMIALLKFALKRSLQNQRPNETRRSLAPAGKCR